MNIPGEGEAARGRVPVGGGHGRGGHAQQESQERTTRTVQLYSRYVCFSFYILPNLSQFSIDSQSKCIYYTSNVVNELWLYSKQLP